MSTDEETRTFRRQAVTLIVLNAYQNGQIRLHADPSRVEETSCQICRDLRNAHASCVKTLGQGRLHASEGDPCDDSRVKGFGSFCVLEEDQTWSHPLGGRMRVGPAMDYGARNLDGLPLARAGQGVCLECPGLQGEDQGVDQASREPYAVWGKNHDGCEVHPAR